MRRQDCFLTSHVVHITNCLHEQVKVEGHWEVAISEVSYLNRAEQTVTDGKFSFDDAVYSKATTAYYLEPELYSSVPDLVEDMNMLTQERNK